MGRTTVLPPSSPDATSRKGSTKSTENATPGRHVPPPPSSNENVPWTFQHHGGGPTVESLQTRNVPREQEENPESMDVRAFMMSLGAQENRNCAAEEVVVSPGVVFVGGTYGRLDEVTVFDDVDDAPIVARLAPDDADVEAMVNERLATMVMPVVKEVEERLRQQKELNRASFATNENIMLTDASIVVPPPPPPPGLKKRRRLIMAVIFLVVIGAGVAVLLRKVDDSHKKDQAFPPQSGSREDLVPSEAPSLTPIPLEILMDELRSWIAPPEVDESPFLDSRSPQSQALAWLQDDPITQSPGRSTQTVLERYVLAVFHYSTGVPSWHHDSWMSPDDVCTWNRGRVDVSGKSAQQLIAEEVDRVHCSEDGESIQALGMIRNDDLFGSLPWEFVLLSNLRYLNLNENYLTGTIPTRIGDLTNLEVFMVGSNKISGPLPTTLGQLTNLIYLDLSINSLTGPIPSELGPLSSLISAFFQYNSLDGLVEESLCVRPWSSLGADCAEVDCPCCTMCCYNDEAQCDLM